MKIALLGYGKMGKIIEQIAIDRKHEIVLKIDQDNQHELTAENLGLADVAIEFSTPATVLANINHCLNAGANQAIFTDNFAGQVKIIYGTLAGCIVHNNRYPKAWRLA